MNLCLYTATFLPTIGGAELVLHELASALAGHGHGVTVLAPFVRRADNHLKAIYHLRRYQRPSSKRFGVRQVLLYLLHEYWQRPFDVLHCHGAYPPAYVGAAFKRLLKTPMVVRPHGADIIPGEFIRAHARLEARLRSAMGAADLVIARAGAMTIAELAACGCPAILVPLPQAIYNHQAKNAAVMESAGAAIVLPQYELSGERLASTIRSVLTDPQRLQDMRARSLALRRVDAAGRIVEECLSLLGRSHEADESVGVTGS